jgi:DNA-binding winged helix-turn-helix (wHTH) protein/TolB-like protein
MSQTPQPVRFGMFEFDLASLDLRRQGTRVAIEPQPAKALALLVQHAGDVVSRDALKQHLWNGDVHVDFDRGLAYVIAQVRSALGDSADNPRFIETLPKRGFRFIAPIMSPNPGLDLRQAQVTPSTSRGEHQAELRSESVNAGSKDPTSSFTWIKVTIAVVLAAVVVVAIFAWRSERPVLAVAIFDNETGQAQYDQFTAGMADAVIGRLGKLDLDRLGLIGNAKSLRMPRSARDLTEIKAETGASFILISGLRAQDDGVRLLSQLIRLSDGRHVWVERFDRPAGQLSGLEAEVLARVEAGVRTRILGEAAQ